MKLSRLASTTERHSRAAVERSRAMAEQDVRRVEVAEGVEGDRQRSIQQEMAEADPNASGQSKQMLRDAQEVALKLVGLQGNLDDLVKSPSLPPGFSIIDEHV